MRESVVLFYFNLFFIFLETSDYAQNGVNGPFWA